MDSRLLKLPDYIIQRICSVGNADPRFVLALAQTCKRALTALKASKLPLSSQPIYITMSDLSLPGPSVIAKAVAVTLQLKTIEEIQSVLNPNDENARMLLCFCHLSCSIGPIQLNCTSRSFFADQEALTRLRVGELLLIPGRMGNNCSLHNAGNPILGGAPRSCPCSVRGLTDLSPVTCHNLQTNLTTLNLGGISLPDLSFLLKCQELRKLYLDCVLITGTANGTEPPTHPFANLQQLETLQLSFLGADPDFAFDPSQNPNLDEVKGKPFTILRFLPFVPHVHFDKGIMPNSTSIKNYLHASFNGLALPNKTRTITFEGIEGMFELPDLFGEYDGSVNFVGGKITKICEARNCTQISFRHCKHLLNFRGCNSAKSITIMNSPISLFGIKQLATVQELTLRKCDKLDPDCICALQKNVNNRRLSMTIDVADCRLLQDKVFTLHPQTQ